MSAYGVPDDLAGVLPWAWAAERLVANRNYWVVTVSAGGRPHALPVWGVWRADPDRFWFSCAPAARKLRNVIADPRCVVAVDSTVEVVSVEGRARRVDADDEGEADRVEDMIAAYLAKYWDDAGQREQMRAFLRANALVEVTPERAFGVIEREEDFARRATRWRW